MAFFRCIGGGSGSGSDVTFTPGVIFDETGISSTGWTATDGATAMEISGGTYNPTAGQYVQTDASHQTELKFAIPGSYYMFGVRFEVDPTFTPKNTGAWYDASCIIGQELGGEQKDFGIIINKDGYISLGWANSSITPTAISALDGQIHECFVVAEETKIKLFVDGVMAVSETKIMQQNEMTKLGVFYNASSYYNSHVYGKIYAVGYWTENMPQINYILPSL